jgi:hypothetical protein
VQDPTKVPLYKFDFLLKLANSKKTYRVLVSHETSDAVDGGLKATLTFNPWMTGNPARGVCHQY